MIQINGMAHVNLTVTSFPAAVEFYGHLLPFLGLQKVHESNKFVYWVGGRTGMAIQPCDPTYGTESFQKARVGLHHLCFRARERKDVDLTAAFLRDIGAHIVRGPQTGDWATGYYYVLFEVLTRSAWKSVMSPAKAFWPRTRSSTLDQITERGPIELRLGGTLGGLLKGREFRLAGSPDWSLARLCCLFTID
jgi:catechol 2,3-dioxygenase-like lactoylglutathione lyase family enzyme